MKRVVIVLGIVVAVLLGGFALIWFVLFLLAVTWFLWFRRTPMYRAHRRIGVVSGKSGFGGVAGQSGVGGVPGQRRQADQRAVVG